MEAGNYQAENPDQPQIVGPSLQERNAIITGVWHDIALAPWPPAGPGASCLPHGSPYVTNDRQLHQISNLLHRKHRRVTYHTTTSLDTPSYLALPIYRDVNCVVGAFSISQT